MGSRFWWIALPLLAVAAFALLVTEPEDSSTADPPPRSEPEPAVFQATTALVDDARINAADTEPQNWLAYGRDYYEQRFSPLDSINQESVGRLGLAWVSELASSFALQSTPIVVDGIIYFSTNWRRVHALDAATGESRWVYDPQTPREFLRKACCGPVNRGVAVYGGRVYVATLDGFLVSIDASNGKELWRVDTIVDRTRNYSITGAPRAAKGKIFIGNGGAEFGVRGYVTAYDAQSGDQVWRFYTVPGNPAEPFEHPEMELAATTWKGGEWWNIGGGGTVWNSIVYDPDFDQVYLGVGNGAPWTRTLRSPGGGDNLFLASIVAVDADTGSMNWYYQTTPGDNWDYTAVQDMMLAEMDVDGARRKVLMQAPKNGFFYVLDREDGELLRANPFVTTTWASHVDMASGRPVETEQSDYSERPKWIVPGPLGGHNWQAMSFDASSGLVYFPAQQNPLLYAMSDEVASTGVLKRNPGQMNLGIELGRIAQLIDETPGAPEAVGYLKAFDPLTGKEAWSVEHPHYWNGGVMASAGGLVFQGDALGYLSAYASDRGERLWHYNTYTSMVAPPISYQVGTTQYVAILAGGAGDNFGGHTTDTAAYRYGSYGKLLVFKLDGSEELPEPFELDKIIPDLKPLSASTEDIDRGNKLYHEACAVCHGVNVKSAGAMPDLRMMRTQVHDRFAQIVLEGTLSNQGMAGFADLFDVSDVQRIHAYINDRAIRDRAAALATP
ncbi:MAG: PQQ-dependent dehydrogenase, methanol/ethanol family [Proteobacteria bacterium]|nr:PQQ-dependent dehydrogenase, methanol/ethanol family [Pseudomonadota bacterium]